MALPMPHAFDPNLAWIPKQRLIFAGLDINLAGRQRKAIRVDTGIVRMNAGDLQESHYCPQTVTKFHSRFIAVLMHGIQCQI
jgi:hypothetical protein